MVPDGAEWCRISLSDMDWCRVIPDVVGRGRMVRVMWDGAGLFHNVLQMVQYGT